MFLPWLLGALTHALASLLKLAVASVYTSWQSLYSGSVHWIRFHCNLALHFAVLQRAALRAVLSFPLRMQALKAAKVNFIVAPFEADAQMAYLAVNGLVHAVITEDSDLLPYGCPRVGHISTV